MSLQSVKIYVKSYCPYCSRAKDFLTQKKVPFEVQDIENDPESAQKLFARTGFKTVPQIFIGDECIGGYDDMIALERQGLLNAKLGL